MPLKVIVICGLFLQFAAAQNLLPSTAPAPSPGTSNPSFTLEERWSHYLRRSYSWQRMGLLGADLAVDTAVSRPDCGRTAECFGDRYAGAFFRRSTRTTVEFLAGVMLKEDIRRRPSGRTGLAPRLSHALTHAFTAYQPDGKARPSYSRILGAAGGMATYAAWGDHPITTGLMAHSVSWALASNVQDSLLNEFGPDMRRIGMRMKNHLMPWFH